MKVALYRTKTEIKFEPRDLWIGAYWNYKNDGWKFGKWQLSFDLYICILPCFPIHMHWNS